MNLLGVKSNPILSRTTGSLSLKKSYVIDMIFKFLFYTEKFAENKGIILILFQFPLISNTISINVHSLITKYPPFFSGLTGIDVKNEKFEYCHIFIFISLKFKKNSFFKRILIASL